jgi:hypothetical protein
MVRGPHLYEIYFELLVSLYWYCLKCRPIQYIRSSVGKRTQTHDKLNGLTFPHIIMGYIKCLNRIKELVLHIKTKKIFHTNTWPEMSVF